MKVRDVMHAAAICCKPETNIGAAVELLWSHNCGMLPVVNKQRRQACWRRDRPRHLHRHGHAQPLARRPHGRGDRHT